MQTAISYIECSQVAGLIQKVSNSSLKAPSVCAAIFQQLSEDILIMITCVYVCKCTNVLEVLECTWTAISTVYHTPEGQCPPETA